MITAADIIAVAQEQRGYVEPANGRTKYGKWYADLVGNNDFEDAPWCDMSVVWCAFEAGRRKGGVNGGHDALGQIGKFAYTPWHAGWFAHKGRFGNKPKNGDLVFFDWGASRNLDAIDHVGLVIGSTDQGEVITLEGNTTDAKTGKAVFAKRYRGYPNIVGFGRPLYASSTQPAATKPEDKPSKPAAKGRFPLPAGHWFGVESVMAGNHSGASQADRPKVRQLQEQLNRHGYKLDTDGVFGTKTKAAVLDFQKDNRLKVDGLAGAATWAAL